jgi:hypothetical protein
VDKPTLTNNDTWRRTTHPRCLTTEDSNTASTTLVAKRKRWMDFWSHNAPYFILNWFWRTNPADSTSRAEQHTSTCNVAHPQGGRHLSLQHHGSGHGSARLRFCSGGWNHSPSTSWLADSWSHGCHWGGRGPTLLRGARATQQHVLHFTRKRYSPVLRRRLRRVSGNMLCSFSIARVFKRSLLALRRRNMASPRAKAFWPDRWPLLHRLQQACAASSVHICDCPSASYRSAHLCSQLLRPRPVTRLYKGGGQHESADACSMAERECGKDCEDAGRVPNH